MRRSRAEALHPSNKVAQADISSASRKVTDPPGVLRFAQADSGFYNVPDVPSVPLMTADYTHWDFKNDFDVAADVVWDTTIVGDGNFVVAYNTDHQATVGLFSVGAEYRDATSMQSKNGVFPWEIGRELWFGIDVSVAKVVVEDPTGITLIAVGLLEQVEEGQLVTSGELGGFGFEIIAEADGNVLVSAYFSDGFTRETVAFGTSMPAARRTPLIIHWDGAYTLTATMGLEEVKVIVPNVYVQDLEGAPLFMSFGGITAPNSDGCVVAVSRVQVLRDIADDFF